MHELGLCASIVEAVEKRAGEREVQRVRVRVGRMHHVHPEAFEQSFAVAALGTVAQDAKPELVLIPIRARCRLGSVWETDQIPLSGPPRRTGRGGFACAGGHGAPGLAGALHSASAGPRRNLRAGSRERSAGVGRLFPEARHGTAL